MRQSYASPGVMAPSTRVVLPFATQVNLVSSATQSTFGTDFEMRLNDAFEPGAAASLHQPYGWDQFSPFYRFYKVEKARVRLTILNAASNYSMVAWRLLAPGTSSTFAGSTTTQVLERPGVHYRWATSGAGKPLEVAFDVDFAELAGVSKQAFDADISEYSAATTTDPLRRFYLQMNTACIGATSVAVQAMVSVEYHVKFWQRETLAQS